MNRTNCSLIIKHLLIMLFSLALVLSTVDINAQVAGGKRKVKKKKVVIKEKIAQKNKMATNIIDPDDDSMSGTLEWSVVISDDNGNVELPERFRTWWYVRLDGINKTSYTNLHIVGDGFPGRTIVLPVYSYDKINWHRLKPENIINTDGKSGQHNYTIHKKFDSSNTVWVARYYPYSFAKLTKYIASIKKNKYVKVETIGKSTRGKPIKMITITDPKVKDKNKKRIWIHARTHPSETGNSYVIEGLIDFLLSDCNEHCQNADLSKLIFNIVPMVNIDGVMRGNARVTPDSSYDLERMWFRDKNDFALRDTCPPEVKALHSAITKLNKKGPKFIIALNLHSKNSPSNWRSFLYTNFKKENKKYGEEGDTLFRRQLNFAKLLSDYYCGDSIDVRRSEESSLTMEKKLFPEVWWWMNFKDKVMAATLETTSGIDGCFEEWVTYKDHLMLGEAIAKASNQYYKYYVSKKYFRYERPCEDIEELMKFIKGNGIKK